MMKDMTIDRKAQLSPRKMELLKKLMGGTSDTMEQSAIPRSTGEGRYPLSFAQQRLWFLDQLVPENPAYNTVIALHLTGEVREALLEESLNRVVRRHDVLRTTIHSENGQPYQVVAPSLHIPIVLQDWSSLSPEEGRMKFDNLAREEGRYIFQLNQGPLLRVKLCRMAEDKWILLVNIHHITIDGWSVGILLKELITFYKALIYGTAAQLPELEIQYGDYAAWQREWAKGQELQRQLAYWRKELGDSRDIMELPADFTRPPIQTFKGGSFGFEIDPGLTGKIKALGDFKNVTLYMVLLTALKVMLHRYSGQPEVIVGSPIANRNRMELENLIGFFVNSITLKTNMSGNPSFLELLDRVRNTANSAYQNQDVPFEWLVDELNLDRNLSHNPLFQVCFVLQNIPMPKGDLSDLGFTLDQFDDVRNDSSKFDLWIQAKERGDNLTIDVEYNSDIFSEHTVRNMMDSFHLILEGVTEQPELPLSRYAILSESERDKVTKEFNNTAVSYPDAHCSLDELLAAQAARMPEATALRFRGTEMTYRELDIRSNQLAHLLIERGMEPGALVGICMERSIELVIALVGVLKAGGAYVPLDPQYPLDRLVYMVEDADVLMVLSHSKFNGVLPAHRNSLILRMDEEEGNLRQQSMEAVQRPKQGDQLAYMIYTSGSTGKPKGSLNTHQAIVNRLLWMQETYSLNNTDRVLQKTAYSFDVSVWEFFWPLMTGAILVLAEPEGHKDASYLVELIRKEEITTVHFVPSMLQVFLEEEEVSSCSSLRRVICSGETLPYSTQERFFSRLGAELHNLYGPTEAAIDVTAWACKDSGKQRIVPIGKPVANTQIYILDQYMQPVPIGVPGEIFIGGIQVSQGYHRKPELTKERFIPDPFTAQAGARLYKTGDLAKFRTDGNIEYLGRMDFQVKVRGFRIEPEEIEAVLEEHPGIHKAVVAAYSAEDASQHKQLVAWVVPDTDAKERGIEDSDVSMPNVQVSEWETVFEKAYDTDIRDSDPDSSFNISSWNSSYTGEPLSVHEMGEWVQSTIERVFNLRPKRIMEIGCGTGLLLSRIAPYCQEYYATDISDKALNHIANRIIREKSEFSHVTLAKRAAENFSFLQDKSFDTVILNSVIQYFPDLSYLRFVIKQAVKLVASQGDGTVYIGDVRSLPLLETFYAEVELAKSEDLLSIGEFNRHVRRSMAREQELVIDPEFFRAMQQECPEISHVHLELKQGREHNELTRYRYDVALYIGSSPVQLKIAHWEEWNGLGYKDFRQMVSSDLPSLVAIKGIPNQRLESIQRSRELLTEMDAHNTVGAWREKISTGKQGRSWDPAEIQELCKELGYDVNISWSELGEGLGFFNLVMRWRLQFSGERGLPLLLAEPVYQSQKTWQDFSNNPLLERKIRTLTTELRHFAKEKLPDHMLPVHYTFLKEMPLGSNGKLDRKRLPSPVIDNILENEDDYVAASSETETLLAGIWAEVLGLERVGIHHNFFALGGDSIHSIRVVARAKQHGVAFTPQQLFQNQTIHELVRVLEEEHEKAEPRRKGPVLQGTFAWSDRDAEWSSSLIQQEDIEDVYPLAPFQAHMLDHFLKSPDPGLYLVQNIMISPISSELDPEFIRRVWQHLVDRHPLLRTSFEWDNLDQPLQIVHKHAEVSLNFEDWRNLKDDERDQRLRTYLEKDRTEGIALRSPRGIRLLIGQMSDSFLLALSFSYMCLDGWSFNTIFSEVDQIISALSAGKGLELRTLRPFKDNVISQQRSGEEYNKAFWDRLLPSGQPFVPYAVSIKGNVQHEEQGFARQCTTFSLEVSERLRQVAREHELTLGTFMQGIWSLLQSYHSGQEAVIYGVLLNGRSGQLEGIEDMVGPFLNILPLRVDVDKEQLALQWLKSLMMRINELGQHQNTPLHQLKKWGVIPGDKPFAENYLVFQNVTDDELDAKTTNHFFVSKMGFPLRVDVYPDKRIALHMSYYRSIFNDSSISKLIKGFGFLMELLANQPESLRLTDLMKELDKDSLLEGSQPEVFYEGHFKVEQIRAQMLKHD